MSFLRFIWFYLGTAQGRYLAGLTMTIIEGLATAVPALAVGLGLAQLVRGGAAPIDMAPFAAAIVAAVLIRVIVIRFAWRWGYEAGNVATEEIRNTLVDHMRRAPLGILQRWSAAKLASLITEDGRWVNEVAGFTLHRMAAGAATTVCLVVAIWFLDPLIGCAVVLAYVAGFFAVPVAARIMKQVVGRRNANLAIATQRIGEYADGIAVFRSFGQTGRALAQLHDAVQELYNLMMAKTPILVALGQTTNALIGLSVGAAIALTAIAALWHGYTPDAPLVIPALFLLLAANNALFVGVIKPIIVLALAKQAHAGMASFLAEPTLSGQSAAFGQPLDVRFEHVSFRYEPDKPEALQEINFLAPQGRVTALVGPSGAGKSTLIALLLRFFDTDNGNISVGGLDIRTADPARLQSLISLVNQDVHLFRDTLRANILLGDPSASDDRLAAVIKAAQLEELVAALPNGLETVLGDTGRTLSGGERQRVAVARALLKDAPIIVLDEATSAMDPLTERSIQQAVAALERGRTVIVVAHRLRSIADADEILVVDSGRIVERGRHSELLDQQGVYATLWQAQERASGWRLR
ncbi:ABC transporter ATP-binding protein (plasmid) [Nitrobacteraceae bacterium UC4446_H13]